MSIRRYNRLLLWVAGLGGLLYGVDIGIIAGALPYLEATSNLTSDRLSMVVAAVLLGSVISTLFAGMLADWLGRRTLMIFGGLLFVASIPAIALSQGYGALVGGRLLQGVSAGLIGVVVPLYLAECLGACNRGRGTAIFQWLLTLGIVAAAVIGMYFSLRVEEVAGLGDADKLFSFKDLAWRSIFWASLPPGLLFVLGCLLITESPRWLFLAGRKADSLSALQRSRDAAQAERELQEMEDRHLASEAAGPGKTVAPDSLLRRKYVIPFLLACIILACTQATGAASIIGFSTTILLHAGLSDADAHWGYVLMTAINFFATIGGVLLVDRKGRKFLLSLGTAGIIVALLATGVLFYQSEKQRVDYRVRVQSLVSSDQTLSLTFRDIAAADQTRFDSRPHTLIVIYSYGGFRAATKVLHSQDPSARPIEIRRRDCVPANRITAFFANPLADLEAARSAPLQIENALVVPVPFRRTGIWISLSLFVFMGFFAVGPGVCVWLALSELLPTRIRSNGISIALLINQAVSTTIAALFLPMVARHGYSAAFFVFAACTFFYFITATFFLPETKGKTLEEIEEYFEKGNP